MEAMEPMNCLEFVGRVPQKRDPKRLGQGKCLGLSLENSQSAKYRLKSIPIVFWGSPDP